MPAILSKFRVVGLHGSKNYSLSLSDNSLIIVGENGSGKTTVLRMMFFFLSGRWQALVQFQFDFVEAEIDGKSYKATRDEIRRSFKSGGGSILRRYPLQARMRIREIVESGNLDGLTDEVVRLGARYGVPSQMIERDILRLISDEVGVVDDLRPIKQVQEAMRSVQDAMGAQILYLPTYRRIERELSSIFEGLDSNELDRLRQKQLEGGQSYVELVEFGMKDVQIAVDRSVTSIRDFARENLNKLTLSYLSDVVNQTYLHVESGNIHTMKNEAVRTIIERIDDSILSGPSKDRLSMIIGSLSSKTGDLTDHEKLVYHYFSTILRFQESLKDREKPISAFCEICNSYMRDKNFLYNSSTFSFSIAAKASKDDEKISLADLSSGEKQIVSLFSHLYLSGISKFFVLIDEPELSLSVPWQRSLLPDVRAGEFCSGVVAVTHSPFVYDNDLRKYAHSLDEFVVYK